MSHAVVELIETDAIKSFASLIATGRHKVKNPHDVRSLLDGIRTRRVTNPRRLRVIESQTAFDIGDRDSVPLLIDDLRHHEVHQSRQHSSLVMTFLAAGFLVGRDEALFACWIKKERSNHR